jgi:hypothetical protein
VMSALTPTAEIDTHFEGYGITTSALHPKADVNKRFGRVR